MTDDDKCINEYFMSKLVACPNETRDRFCQMCRLVDTLPNGEESVYYLEVACCQGKLDK